MAKTRIKYLDYVKAISCILVVIQHISAYGYKYNVIRRWNDYWIYNHPNTNGGGVCI